MRGIRLGSGAARLLGLWFRIPSAEWMSVCCECCVLSVRGLLLGADPSSRGDLPTMYVSVSAVRYNITLYTYNVEVHTVGKRKKE